MSHWSPPRLLSSHTYVHTLTHSLHTRTRTHALHERDRGFFSVSRAEAAAPAAAATAAVGERKKRQRWGEVSIPTLQNMLSVSSNLEELHAGAQLCLLFDGTIEILKNLFVFFPKRSAMTSCPAIHNLSKSN